jgi:hypothetical protein
VQRLTAVCCLSSLCQEGVTPVPSGVTRPTPVHTTRRRRIPSTLDTILLYIHEMADHPHAHTQRAAGSEELLAAVCHTPCVRVRRL